MLIQTTNRVIGGTLIVCYGATGCGKTFMISTAPAPIIVSCDKGLKTLKSFELPFVEVRQEKHFIEFLDWIEQNKESAKYQTICIDDISEFAELILQEQLPYHKDGRQAYGEMQDRMLKHIRRLRDLKTSHNVFIIAKQERIKDNYGNMIYVPMFPGQKLSQLIPHLVDEVYYYQVWMDNTKNPPLQRALRTFQDSQYTGKSRSRNIEPFEYPDLNYLFGKLKQG